DHDRRLAGNRRDEAEANRGTDDDPEEFDSAKRQVGALERALRPSPLLEVSERPLSRLEDGRQGGDASVAPMLLGAPLRLPDVGRNSAADPGAAIRSEDEHQREQHEPAD